MLNEALLQRLAPMVLRLGLVVLFLWFGFSQILAPENWISWVPEWAATMLGMDPKIIVLLNGGFEAVLGIVLLLGLFVRWVALLLALHLLVIAYEIGYNDIGVRDFALAVSCFALALFGGDSWTLMARLARNTSPQNNT